MLALTLVVAAYLLLSLATGYYLMIAALILVGVGLGTMLPNLNAWLLSFVPVAAKGRAIGLMVFSAFMGQFFSPVITQPLTTAAGLSRSYLLTGMLLVPIVIACGLSEYQQRRRMKGDVQEAEKRYV